MITEELLGGKSVTAYYADDLTLLNGATLNGNSNLVKVYSPTNLVFIYVDITLPEITTNGWYNFVELPVVVDAQTFTSTVMSSPSATATAVNRTGRLYPDVANNKTLYGMYAYTGDSGKRYILSYITFAR